MTFSIPNPPSSPLAEAISSGDVSRVESLLAAGEDGRALLVGGVSPLTLAARQKNAQIVHACLRGGLNPHVRDGEFGYWPLQAAAESGDVECLEAMLEAGGRAPSEALDAALESAAEQGNTAFVVRLVEQGAQLRLTANGSNALSKAVLAGHHETARRLVSLTPEPLRRTLLQQALRYFIWESSTAGVRFVLDLAPELYDASMGHCVTPLSDAADAGDAELVALLLACGPCALEGRPDPRPTASPHETPLMKAAWRGNPESVRLLVEAGAWVNARQDGSGKTSLMFACEEPHDDNGETILYLIEQGADREARDSSGLTPLLRAVKQGRRGAVEALLTGGADPSARNGEGLDALALAERHGRLDVLEVLRLAERLAPEPPDRGAT